MIPTLTVLNQLLASEDLPQAFGVTKVECETLGRRTEAFIETRNLIQRRRIEDRLLRAGCDVNRSYRPDGTTIQVRVAYLRARGWNRLQ